MSKENLGEALDVFCASRHLSRPNGVTEYARSLAFGQRSSGQNRIIVRAAPVVHRTDHDSHFPHQEEGIAAVWGRAGHLGLAVLHF